MLFPPPGVFPGGFCLDEASFGTGGAFFQNIFPEIIRFFGVTPFSFYVEYDILTMLCYIWVNCALSTMETR